MHSHTPRDADRALVVRFSRHRSLAAGLLFAAIAGPSFADAAERADIGRALLALPFVALACLLLWAALRARPQLLIDDTGITFCAAGVHISWSAIAAVEIQAWQGTLSLSHRLSLRAVQPERFDQQWDTVRWRPWISRPHDGRIGVVLDLLSPSLRAIAQAIRECSDGAFACELRTVAQRPFRHPESA